MATTAAAAAANDAPASTSTAWHTVVPAWLEKLLAQSDDEAADGGGLYHDDEAHPGAAPRRRLSWLSPRMALTSLDPALRRETVRHASPVGGRRPRSTSPEAERQRKRTKTKAVSGAATGASGSSAAAATTTPTLKLKITKGKAGGTSEFIGVSKSSPVSPKRAAGAPGYVGIQASGKGYWRTEIWHGCAPSALSPPPATLPPDTCQPLTPECDLAYVSIAACRESWADLRARKRRLARTTTPLASCAVSERTGDALTVRPLRTTRLSGITLAHLK